MKLSFTDYPQYIPNEGYDLAQLSVIEKLSAFPELVSIYQIGSISDPGISDIDLIAVFKNEISFIKNPLEGFDNKISYLFKHGLFGVSINQFKEAQKYSIFKNYRKLWGEEIENGSGLGNDSEAVKLKYQIATEYLLKYFMVMTIETIYGMTKIRALFLEGKALGLDLEILEIRSGKIIELIEELIEMRKQWFSKAKLVNRLGSWHREFIIALQYLLVSILDKNPIRFPNDASVNFGRNIIIKRGGELLVSHQGIILPSFLVLVLGRKYFNLLHRFNSFDFTVPGEFNNKIDDLIARRFVFQEQCLRYNQEHLPYFSPLVTGLGI